MPTYSTTYSASTQSHDPNRRRRLDDAELAENDCRKDFTVSERVAIGQALEGEMAGRVGRPANGGKNSTISEDEPAGKTRDIAAKAAGFGNGKTYEQAKQVVQQAAPERVFLCLVD